MSKDFSWQLINISKETSEPATFIEHRLYRLNGFPGVLKSVTIVKDSIKGMSTSESIIKN